MFKDFTLFFWLLKLGAPLNLYFLVNTYALPSTTGDAHILVPARIFFAVSVYRCLFPVQYKNNVVFHDFPLSSIFLTRLLATASEIAYIYQFSYVIRLLDTNHVVWVSVSSWMMVVQVVISQCFVWGAILTERLAFYFYEELGWAIIFAINTIASAYLYETVDTLGGARSLIYLNLLFGVVYLPWQFMHLRVLCSDAEQNRGTAEAGTGVSLQRLKEGLRRSIHVRNRRSDADAWSRLVGLSWMMGYWATLIPMWVNQIVVVLSRWH